MNLQKIYEEKKKDLEQIERELARSIQTDHETLQMTSTHLLEAGGKRMRPVFVLLAGSFGSYELKRLQKVAVSLELIHMATLVHDDVIDNAATRRGRKTVKEEWDNRIAMYTGDYILARALKELTDLPNHHLQETLATALMRMCLGEIAQIQDLFSEQQSLKKYLRRIKRKTALLMAVSCQLGALVSGVKPAWERALTAYGYYVGMAFQLTDDVLDFVGDEKTLGKPAGSDLQQGNVTLPVIYALHQGSEECKRSILAYLRSKGESGSLSEILEMIRKSGGIEYTMDLTRRYMDKAFACLKKLPATPERESLKLIAEFILRRSY
ncbi:polyprenyl synthetase family protein [Laceyella putida]|uniref:Polyprenyl synthetase family protein n=1 Tax=Laceyella putida TaxID=110101 RepID=A0ABW2RM70_9BACL